ncbi:hypothetical protein [Sphingomonas asaccharolytica]|uniref:hypothetical protein n=1 Tax=Sphingomonas asaccharolytica TaxID=40681 RepID=UPI000A422908|nr:hypothetical protein [Sphingomonas asaccharolytica]
MANPRATASAFILPRPWGEDVEFLEYRREVLRALDGLQIDASVLNPDSPIGTCSISIRSPHPDEATFVGERLFRAGIKGSIVLDISSEDFCLSSMKSSIHSSDGSPLSSHDEIYLPKYLMAVSLSSVLNGCLSIWNICYFGCLNSVYHIASLGEEILDFGDTREFRTLWAVADDRMIAGTPGVKIFPNLALEWSRNCSGFWKGFAETRIQRATACLLRTFSTRTASMDAYGTLMWSLAGLEALYCNNEASIKYQIRKRAPIIVDRYGIIDLDKNISKGYDFRSRLFHGDVKIRSPIADDDSGYTDDKNHKRQADLYADFFCLLLTCSIMAAIEEQSQDVVFEECASFVK